MTQLCAKMTKRNQMWRLAGRQHHAHDGLILHCNYIHKHLHVSLRICDAHDRYRTDDCGTPEKLKETGRRGVGWGVRGRGPCRGTDTPTGGAAVRFKRVKSSQGGLQGPL